mgnify:CR=1 FL=1
MRSHSIFDVGIIIQVRVTIRIIGKRIHVASQGIPRLINHFCSQALYDATQRDPEVIEELNSALGYKSPLS